MNVLIAKTSQQIGMEEGGMSAICILFIKTHSTFDDKTDLFDINMTIRWNRVKCVKNIIRKQNQSNPIQTDTKQNKTKTNQLVKVEKEKPEMRLAFNL